MNTYTKTLTLIAIAAVLSACTNQPSSPKAFNPTTVKQLAIVNTSNVLLKKTKFFQAILPIVQKNNANFLADRQKIQQLIQQNDTQGLQTLAIAYGVDYKTDKNWQHELLSRADEIPVILALAQAAYESMWGQSRFAKQANNLFGQMCYQKGCGIVPKKREAGAKREVAKFDSIEASVKSYMQNLNTHSAYQEFRSIREQLRSYGQPLDAVQLAAGLELYSKQRNEYVKTIRSMIHYNEGLIENISRSDPQSISLEFDKSPQNDSAAF